MSSGAFKASFAQPSWQLRMLSQSLKKQQKLKLLQRQIGETQGKECVLITHGDNSGALNYRLREGGGNWTWVDHEAQNIEEMEQFLGQPVLQGGPDAIPVDDDRFDVVVSIDVHEHLDDCAAFNRELRRIARCDGLIVVTTPNGDRWKSVTVLKKLIGMSRDTYGHKVLGYNVEQHRAMLSAAGLAPIAAGSYSKFFTELIELGINFAYVKVLSRKAGETAGIAPTSARQLRSVEKQYRLYRCIYPLLWTISKLDRLLFMFTGYAISVVARKERLGREGQ